MQYATLPGASDGLLVNDLPTPNRDHDDLWKVSYVHDEIPYALSSVVFARRMDAERAKVALDQVADWTQPLKEVIDELRSKNWTPAMMTQLMAEAIQW